MAVQHPVAWIIGDQGDVGRLSRRDEHGVGPLMIGDGRAVAAQHPEAVAMEMHRVPPDGPSEPSPQETGPCRVPMPQRYCSPHRSRVDPCLCAGEVFAADDLSVNASACSVAAGGNASNNTLTCNFGLTPEQLRQVTKAVEGATSPLMDRIEDIGKRLGITEDGAKTLLRIVGEQTDVPDDRLADVVTKVAASVANLEFA